MCTQVYGGQFGKGDRQVTVAPKVKQYHKEGQALRTETTINDTYDFEIGRALRNLPALREIGFAVNRRLLCVESRARDHVRLRQHEQGARAVGRRPESRGAGRDDERGVDRVRPERRSEHRKLRWPSYDTKARSTMIFADDCRVVDDPGGAERRLWATV